MARDSEGVASELRRSNAALDEFASVAAHDLQEPLRKIQIFGERLHTRHLGQLDAEGQDCLRRMLAATDRMRTLIDALLKYARLAHSGSSPGAISLEVVIAGVILDLESQIERTGGTVVVDPLPLITARPDQMRQLFQNLIGNALKFQRAGVAPRVRIFNGNAGAGDAAWHQIVVEDNGIGFEPRHVERIFRPLERLHGSRVYEGTGMGLAVCRRIVEQHGGTITAAGRPGEGARFCISLPVAPVAGISNGNDTDHDSPR